MADVAIVILCGIPGCGKTTVARKMRERVNSGQTSGWLNDTPTLLHHVCYDQMMSSSLEAEIINRSEKDQESANWKHHRQKIKQCVESCISSLVTETETRPDQEDNLFDENFRDKLSAFAAPFVQKSMPQGRHVFVVDDNMYLASMRHEFFQMSKKHETAFAQVFVICPMEVALERNRVRNEAVPERVITNMAAKFEQPNQQNHWEKYTAAIDTSKDIESQMPSVVAVIEEALRNPSENYEEDLIRASESRAQCSESALHQADLILRKLVSTEIMTKKADGLAKKDLSSLAAALNRKKNDLLENLRTGKLLIPKILNDSSADASKDSTSELYQLLQTLWRDQT